MFAFPFQTEIVGWSAHLQRYEVQSNNTHPGMTYKQYVFAHIIAANAGRPEVMVADEAFIDYAERLAEAAAHKAGAQ